MRVRGLLLSLVAAPCLALAGVSAAAADPLSDLGNGLAESGVDVDLPAVPQVELPHVGAPPVDDVIDTVNETVGGTTDAVNEVTDSLDGGGGEATEPPAATSPTETGGDPTGAPVETGAPTPATSSPTPAAADQPGSAGGGSQPAGAGAGAGGAAALAGGPGGGGGRGGAQAPAEPANPDGAAPTQSSPFIAVFEALPWSLWALIGALALIGVGMSARSAWGARHNRILRRERGELQDDVGALQSALLPAIPDQIGETALGVAYRPAEGPAAGGDFHDVLALADGRIGIVVGDVCGHGREALANTALVHYTVRAYLEAGVEPREALRMANIALSTKLGDDFAAVLAAVYDPETSTLDYATAGHPTPLIAGERDRAVAALTPAPLGVGLRTGHRQTKISIRPGSRVWFFTDGLVEARDAEGEMVGREGLAEILAESGEADPEAILDRLAEAEGARDDMTAFVLTPGAAAGDGSVEEEIEIDADLATGDGLERFLAACGLDPGEVERAVDAARRRLRLAGSARIRARTGAVGPRWEISGGEAPTAPSAPSTPPAARRNGSTAEGETILTGSST